MNDTRKKTDVNDGTEVPESEGEIPVVREDAPAMAVPDYGHALKAVAAVPNADAAPAQEGLEAKEKRLRVEAKNIWLRSYKAWNGREFAPPYPIEALDQEFRKQGWEKITDLPTKKKRGADGKPLPGWVRNEDDWNEAILAYKKDGVIIFVPALQYGGREPTINDQHYCDFGGEKNYDPMKCRWSLGSPGILVSKATNEVGPHQRPPKKGNSYNVLKKAVVSPTEPEDVDPFRQFAKEMGQPLAKKWNEVAADKSWFRKPDLIDELKKTHAKPLTLTDPELQKLFADHLFFAHYGFVYAVPRTLNSFLSASLLGRNYKFTDQLGGSAADFSGEKVITKLKSPIIICEWPLSGGQTLDQKLRDSLPTPDDRFGDLFLKLRNLILPGELERHIV